MQKQVNMMARHWKKMAAAAVTAAGAYYAVPAGYEMYQNREKRIEQKEANIQEIENTLGIKPLLLNDVFRGRDVGLYEAQLPFSSGARLCALRVEYNGDPHRSVTIDYCLPSAP